MFPQEPLTVDQIRIARNAICEVDKMLQRGRHASFRTRFAHELLNWAMICLGKGEISNFFGLVSIKKRRHQVYQVMLSSVKLWTGMIENYQFHKLIE